MRALSSLFAFLVAFALLAGNELRFCGDVSTWGGLRQNVDYYCSISLSPSEATELAGNKIASIEFSAALSQSLQLSGHVFVIETSGEKAVWQEAEFVNCNAEPPLTQKVAFDQPYIIKENCGFSIGYHIEGCDEYDWPFALDEGPLGLHPGTIETKLGDETLQKVDLKDVETRNLYLVCYLEDEGELSTNFLLGDCFLGASSLPVVPTGDLIAYLEINNIGSTPITEIEYSATAMGLTESRCAEVNIQPGETALASLPVGTVESGIGEAQIWVSRINRKAFEFKADMPYVAIDEADAYPRFSVVEYVSNSNQNQAAEKYAAVASVASHYGLQNVNIHFLDKLECEGYGPVVANVFSEFPAWKVNRDEKFAGYEHLELESVLSDFDQPYTYAQIADIEVYEEDNTIKAEATISYGIDIDINADYCQIIFLEDGVEGLYDQVPRYASEPLVLPKRVAKGQEYKVGCECPSYAIGNPEKAWAIALLINGQTQTIANSYANPCDEGLGISDPQTEGDAQLYDMMGRKMPMEGAARGIYIERSVSGSRKVFIGY